MHFRRWLASFRDLRCGAEAHGFVVGRDGTRRRTGSRRERRYRRRPGRVSARRTARSDEPVKRSTSHPPPIAMTRRTKLRSATARATGPRPARRNRAPDRVRRNHRSGRRCADRRSPVSSMRGSLPNRPSQACGQIAAARPIASVNAKAIAPPVRAMRSARACWPAPMLVPTSATSGAPRSENQRDEQIFQARAGAVSRDCVRSAGCAHQRGGECEDERGLQGIDRTDRAHAQDVDEQRLAQA